METEEESPPEQVEAPPSEEAPTGTTSFSAAVANIKQLAPVRLTSGTVMKENGEIKSQFTVEGEIDARGNSHYVVNSSDSSPFEYYIVDGEMYMGNQQDGFFGMGEADSEGEFAMLAIAGGGWLFMFTDMSEAQKIGSEQVNGFTADKYELKVDPSVLGLGIFTGAAMEGKDFDYQSTIWVEPTSNAIVKGEVDWYWEEDGKKEEYSNRLDVTKVSVSEISAPETMEFPE